MKIDATKTARKTITPKCDLSRDVSIEAFSERGKRLETGFAAHSFLMREQRFGCSVSGSR
jgi:hypothetical protein